MSTRVSICSVSLGALEASFLLRLIYLFYNTLDSFGEEEIGSSKTDEDV